MSQIHARVSALGCAGFYPDPYGLLHRAAQVCASGRLLPDAEKCAILILSKHGRIDPLGLLSALSDFWALNL